MHPKATGRAALGLATVPAVHTEDEARRLPVSGPLLSPLHSCHSLGIQPSDTAKKKPRFKSVIPDPDSRTVFILGGFSSNWVLTFHSSASLNKSCRCLSARREWIAVAAVAAR